MVETSTPLRAPRAWLLTAMLPLALVAGCPKEGGPSIDAGPPQSTFTIGEEVDESVCEDDIDCPPGFACRAGACRAIDNDLDNDGYEAAVDCDDADPARHPGVAEVCDGEDNNCSGDADEGVKNACGQCGDVPEEICDLADNDCDGLIDEDCSAGGAEETEPNDGAANCQAIALPPNEGETTIISGAFDPPGDKDSFCFFVRPGTELRFDLDSYSLGANSDGVLQLFGENGQQLPGGYEDYTNGPDPILNYVFANGGNIRLDVYNFESTIGGPDVIYNLNVTAVSLVECLDEDGDGVSVCDDDCADDDIMVFPNQTEVCDGVDNNCDTVVDEECPDLTRRESEPNNAIAECELVLPPFKVSGAIDPRRDADTYCFFATQGMRLGFDIDAKEDSASLLNSEITLYALPENQLARNDDGTDPDTGYTAEDSDSYLEYTFNRPGIYAIRVEDWSISAGGIRLTYVLHGNVISAPPCADADGDGVSTCEGDCVDSDPEVHFGALEVCDGKDNNCDVVGDPEECTGDFDGDGYAGTAGDCDDANLLIHPGATEVCDGVDNDCDGEVDEGVGNACGGCGFAPAERCGDNIDNNCDGTVDEATCSADGDADGVTPDQGDCDDGDAAVHPNAAEVCNYLDDNCDGLVDEYVKNSCGSCGEDPAEICDGLDNNCNGRIDDGVVNSCGFCGPEPVEICDGLDNNCDAQIDEGVTNACGECGPAPVEICDGLDNDCDGETDEGCDADEDNDGFSLRDGDCNDGNPTVYWGAEEVCGNGVDNDCDGFVDEVPCTVPTEAEPNPLVSSCTPMRWPGRIDGAIGGTTDVDVYCFEVTVPGTRLGFDIDARPLGSPLDSYLRVLSSTGATLDVANNGVDPQSGNFGEDTYLVYEFEEAGNYAIQVSGSSTAAVENRVGSYQLHTLPVDGCLDLDGDRATTCAGDCDDFNASTQPGAVDVCDEVDNNCNEVVDDTCVGECLDDRFFGNTSFASAELVTPGLYEDLTYCGGAFDLFRLPLNAGESLTVDIAFVHAESNLTLRVFDPEGLEVGESATTANNESVTYEVQVTGQHYIQVSGPLSGEGSYEMNVSVVTP